MYSPGRCSLRLAGKNALHLLQPWRELEACFERQGQVGLDTGHTRILYAAFELWKLLGLGSVSLRGAAGQPCPQAPGKLGVVVVVVSQEIFNEKSNKMRKRKMSFRLILV